jgi:hypothetical protein
MLYHGAVLLHAVSLLLSIAPTEVQLPGTQPSSLTTPPEASNACNCHGSYTGQFIEPGKTWRGTMMTLSARDPLFKTALAVAHADRPQLSDLCIRCHAPLGWLEGRSMPSDGSALEGDDLESVTCDICHRMVPTSTAVSPTQLIGDGQYTISQSAAKRAHRGVAPRTNIHTVVQSDFVQSSEACGACHSLFNPNENAHTPTGEELGFPYYEQRTYEEWASSAFKTQKTCIDCHMPRAMGKAANQGLVAYPDLAVHLIVGGNTFSPAAVNLTDPNFPLSLELPFIEAAVDKSLHDAVTLAITSTLAKPLVMTGRDSIPISVRVTNNTGHKLPTGYPEGRRVYIEVSFYTPVSSTTAISGAWDPTTGQLVGDAQLRTYETQHGRIEGGISMRVHSVSTMNQILFDTRIPPQGFTPIAEDMIPSGRSYGDAPPYRNYDDVTYGVTAPDVVATSTGTITFRVKYQVTDGEVVGFLLDRAGRTSTPAVQLSKAWEMLGHAPPRTMAEIKIPVSVLMAPPLPDAGELDALTPDGPTPLPDGSFTFDADMPVSSGKKGGCSCGVCASRSTSAAWMLLLLISAVARRRSLRT